MKSPTAVAMLALSIILGLTATGVATSWLSKQANASSNHVVVATIDIELGSRLNPQWLKVVDWPSGNVPSGAVARIEDLQDRVVKTNILRGEPILDAKLAPVGSKGGLSAVIPEGKRAMTVRVNDVIGVAGFALPGNYVDIVVNTQVDGEARGDKQISKIVLERILVLAVAQEANRDETKPKVVNAVTLEVTPDQAEKLDLARSVGTLSLVLRNQIDKDGASSDGMMKHDLLGAAAPPTAAAAPKPAMRARRPVHAAAAAPRPKTTVEVIKGVQKGTVEF